MAKPVSVVKRQVPIPEQREAQSLAELTHAVAEHKDALLQTLQLVHQLQDSGLLEMLTALLAAREEVGKTLLHQVMKPNMTNSINNAMALAGVLGQIDPAVTRQAAAGLLAGVQAAGEAMQQPKKLGLLGLLRSLKDPGVNRALAVGLHFLRSFGAAL